MKMSVSTYETCFHKELDVTTGRVSEFVMQKYQKYYYDDVTTIIMCSVTMLMSISVTMKINFDTNYHFLVKRSQHNIV